MKFLFFILVFFSCKKEFKTQVEIFKFHEASKLKNYSLTQKYFQNRVHNLDDLRKNLILNINKIDGFDNVPTKSKNFELDKKRILDISKTLPKKISTLFDKYVIGIYFCENLGGSGLTHYISENGKVVGGIIILDSSVLNKTANDWITYKENTVFTSKEFKLEIKIEEEKNNTVENGIRYILLHELGHIFASINGINPDIFVNNSNIESEFYRGIWKKDKEFTDPNVEYDLINIARFYSNQKISLEENWDKIYPQLFNSPFSTLYASTNAGDHFAEGFVSYVHVVMEKKPWTLKISKQDKIIFQMENLITKNQFEMDFFEKLIEKESGER